MQFDDDIEEGHAQRPVLDAIENIIDAREWDVPYHIRVAIDQGISIFSPAKKTSESENGIPSEQKQDKSPLKSSKTDLNVPTQSY